MAAGDAHTCALPGDGSVWCWGRNDRGQLGDGSTTDSTVPVQVGGLDGPATALAAGSKHTCVVTATNVWCWGANESGQLGDGTTNDAYSPVAAVGVGAGIVSIAAGRAHTCALHFNISVSCWGLNGDGQLGNGTNTDSYTAVGVVNLNAPAPALAAGERHTCVSLQFGGLACWGDNTDGQLGDGSTTDRWTPTAVQAINQSVVAIAAGKSHTCSAEANGNIRCWGKNDDGQLGSGVPGGSLTPVGAGINGNVLSLAAGEKHSCAVLDTGAMFCWGDNTKGQLGDGTTVDSVLPAAVSGLPGDAFRAAAGIEHTCSVHQTGNVYCWGRNSDGQLGDGTTTDSLTPLFVLSLP